ncbi:hypothetical protein BDW22DRAFT_1301228, partial [Trametopsis cervina]
LVKIVNGLTAKSESPGPMTCALLLGQPDHYTPESFRVCYWWPFAKYVENTAFCIATDSASQNTQEKVILSCKDGRIIARNQIQDYILRPTEHQCLSLYDFLCTTVVKKITKQHRPHAPHSGECSDVDMDASTDGEEDSGDEPSDNTNEDDVAEQNIRPGTQYYKFQPEHPLSTTHGVFFVKNPVLLNFVGGTLPRRDRGDREEYCRVMLTLFAPVGWRSGLDLKPDGRTWCEVFDGTVFDATHLYIMNNMNLLYECYDAKHDWAA